MIMMMMMITTTMEREQAETRILRYNAVIMNRIFLSPQKMLVNIQVIFPFVGSQTVVSLTVTTGRE